MPPFLSPTCRKATRIKKSEESQTTSTAKLGDITHKLKILIGWEKPLVLGSRDTGFCEAKSRRKTPGLLMVLRTVEFSHHQLVLNRRPIQKQLKLENASHMQYFQFAYECQGTAVQ